jgi:nicotinate-nucleotide--dimethylbenzimidazole phosphoribosyltransferase
MADSEISSSSALVSDSLVGIPGADPAVSEHVRLRAAQILRPAGALAVLDELAVWLAGWQHRTEPVVERPFGLIFAADHGVAADGVSAYPAHLTAEMVKVFAAGRGSVNALARIAGAEVEVVDVGVGRPTGNLRVEAALTPERFAEAFRAGRLAVSERVDRVDLLVLGEMGIGNTTPAAATSAAICGGLAEEWVGRGTGVDDDGLTRKQGVVREALARIADVVDPIERFRHVGGAELVAIAGAVVEARHRSIPVLLDGYVVTAAVAPLHAVDVQSLAHCRSGHASAEVAHRRLLAWLGMSPLLDLGMRLGEASGAMAAVPLLKAACAVVNEVPTFGEWFGEG